MTKTAERYTRAIRSSHLALRRTDEAPGDADTLIAAGLAETMGVLLTRLRGEWDTAAGEVSATQRNVKRLQEARATAVKAAAMLDKDGASLHPFDAGAFDKAAAAELLTARALILMNLRSLEPAKQALFGFAMRQAPHKGCGSEPAELGKLVGQVIDVWLDRICHHCEGRGFSGGYGKAKIMCTKCGGTGSRRQGRLGTNASEQAFGLFLLNVMDSRCTVSMKQVQRRTCQA